MPIKEKIGYLERVVAELNLDVKTKLEFFGSSRNKLLAKYFGLLNHHYFRGDINPS